MARLPNVLGYDVPRTEVGAADLEVRARYKAAGVANFVKTAAGIGFHIVAPVCPEYSSDKVKGGSQVAHTLAFHDIARAPNSERSVCPCATTDAIRYVATSNSGGPEAEPGPSPPCAPPWRTEDSTSPDRPQPPRRRVLPTLCTTNSPYLRCIDPLPTIGQHIAETVRTTASSELGSVPVMRLPASSKLRRRGARLAGALAVLSVVAAVPALAQGWPWDWSWGEPSPPPMPREPIYRGPPQSTQPYRQPYPQEGGGRSGLCLQLEQQLAQEANRGSQSRELLPKLEADIRQVERTYRSGQVQLERMECFEYFLFSKSLRRTRQCVDLNRQVEHAKHQLAELEAQSRQIISSSGRSYQDDIIRELARNNCGASYQQHAATRNPFSSIWQDEDSGFSDGGRFGHLPFATYRTVCVRLCDGYYFPVSFSTLPNHFDRDAEVCQSQCAAPAELFYYQNPGGAMEQAVSHSTREPYTSLKTAFRHRKEYVKGCSCKQTEYVPEAASTERRAEAPSFSAAAPSR
jgi:hypothetical protein